MSVRQIFPPASLKKEYLKNSDFYTADHVAIKFSAVLNKYATTESVGTTNEAVKLTYTNKNDVKGEVNGNKVLVFTYHIQVHKLNEIGKALEGAEFALYKTEADAKEEYNAIAAGTSDKNGLVVFKNTNGEEMLLQSGKYFVKETKAPTGYTRCTDIIPAAIKEGVINDKGYLINDDGEVITDYPVVFQMDLDRLFQDSVAYNVAMNEQQDMIIDFSCAALDLTDYGIYDGIYGYISAPSIRLNIPRYLGASDGNMA